MDTPTFVHPHMFIHPLYIHTPPIGPHALLCTCMVLEHLHVVGGCYLLKCVLGQLPYTTPIWGCLPLNYTPHTSLFVPCALLFSGISVSYVGLSPSIEGFGVFPHHLGRLGAHQLSSCPCAYSCTFFVVHYVSRFDHGSNYYSSSYSGIFWPVISVTSDSGSFPDRVSSKPWHGSTTTLDTEGLWRCSWLCFCATAANSIFNASSGLCQLCYGFSTGRFLFQS